jgi:hypothetical protein
MISRLRPTDFKILSLTTIASPHRGSAFADYMFETIGRTFDTLTADLGLFWFYSATDQANLQSHGIFWLRDWRLHEDELQ